MSERIDRTEQDAHLSVQVDRASNGDIVVTIKHGPETVILPAAALDELIPMLQELHTYLQRRLP